MAVGKIISRAIADNAITTNQIATNAVTNADILDDAITMDKLNQVNLAIAPEVLEIQVDAPAAGQDTAWLWTWEQSTLPYARRTITNSPEVSVPLYREGTYTVNNFAAYDVHGSMTQTHTLYFKWIDGAGTDNLISWATSAGPISDTHPDINGGNATDVQRITINVPATITPPTLTAPSVSYTVTNNANGAYTFSGSAAGDNPNLGPFYKGGTYTININATGHPFYFTTDNGTNFASGTYFGEYTSGVTGSRTDSGTITFTVPSNAPSTLYYQCGNHSSMRGAITIKDLAVETNINGNYVVYAMHTQEGHKTPVELRPIPSLVNQMCLVYDASTSKFVPQDLATYVENTPSFENKIREVAGTAELVVEDGSAVVAKVNVYDDSTYLPLTGNNAGDQAFATDTNILYIWDGSAWQQAGTTNTDDLTEGSTNLFYTNERVDDRVAALVVGGNNITATYDDAAGTLTIDGQPGYTDSDVSTYLAGGSLASIVTTGAATFGGVITGDGSGITNLTFPASQNRYTYTASANQTTFNATYTTGYVDVYVNGVKLRPTTEYDDSNGTSIVLTTACSAGEFVEIIAQNTTSVSDAVSASAGGTFTGDVTINSTSVGPLTVNSSNTNGSYLKLKHDTNTTGHLWIGAYDQKMRFYRNDSDLSMSINGDGKIGIGFDSPSTMLHVLGNNSVPNATLTLQSDDTANATAGVRLMARDASNVNSTATVTYNSDYIAVDTPISNTPGIYMNPSTITTDYSVPVGQNAMSIGPLTVDATITVPSGASWTIV